MIVLHATIAIVAVIALIIVLHVDPVISLVVGSLYLGLAAGLGLEKTLTACALLPLSTAATGSIPVRRVVDPILERFALLRTAPELSAPLDAVNEVRRGIVEVTRALAVGNRWPGIRVDSSEAQTI